VFGAGQRPTEVAGPLLEEEAAKLQEDFWARRQGQGNKNQGLTVRSSGPFGSPAAAPPQRIDQQQGEAFEL
jgi:hypothetical protein